jgi:hypothetical protein
MSCRKIISFNLKIVGTYLDTIKLLALFMNNGSKNSDDFTKTTLYFSIKLANQTSKTLIKMKRSYWECYQY